MFSTHVLLIKCYGNKIFFKVSSTTKHGLYNFELTAAKSHSAYSSLLVSQQ